MTIYDFNFKEPFANGADSSEIQPFPDENRGLGIAFVQTDGKPEMKGLNGLFNKITKALLSLRQNGLLGWVNDIEYIQGGFVVDGKKLYQAKVNNTNRKPSDSQSDWELWTNASNISVDANGNILKNTDIEGAFTLKVNDATTTVKGVARFATSTEVINKSNVSAFVNPNNTAAIAQSTDLGVGQTWKNATSYRSLGVTYTNQSQKPITIFVEVVNTFSYLSSEECTLTIGGLDIKFSGGGFNTSGAKKVANITMTIPPDTGYRLTSQTGGIVAAWWELS